MRSDSVWYFWPLGVGIMKRILFIIPDLPIRNKYTGFLKGMGYDIRILDNPRLVRHAFTQFQADVILCYDGFPGISATDIAETFRHDGNFKKTPFLLLSPDQMPEDTDSLSANKEINDIIYMPVEQAELYGFVTNWIETDNPLPTGSLRSYNQPVEDSEPDTPPVKPSKKNGKGWNKGSVSLYAMGKLFHNLVQSKATGIVLIRGDRRKMKIWIESGNIIDVNSNYIREDTFGRYLVSINKLSKEQNKKSLAIAQQHNLPQGEAMIKLGYLDSKQLREHITDHKIAKILNLFQRRWYKAKFVYNQEAFGHVSPDFQVTPLTKIMAVGIMNVARKKDLYETFFTSNKEKSKLRVCENFHNLAKALELGPTLTEQAMQINGNSIEEIKNIRADQFENNLRLAFLLVVTKGMCFAA